MNTTDRILDAALLLFNQQGTGAVSTNHIADAAGISPGNLYYHFRNKEAIIRALFERLFDLWDVRLTLPSDKLPTLDDVKMLVRTNFEIMDQYRFIYREIVVLLRQDEILQERYIAVRSRGYQGFREIFSMLAPNLDEQTVKRLADASWLVSEFWLAMIEMGGQSVSPEQMQEGIDVMIQILQPYIPTD